MKFKHTIADGLVILTFFACIAGGYIATAVANISGFIPESVQTYAQPFVGSASLLFGRVAGIIGFLIGFFAYHNL